MVGVDVNDGYGGRRCESEDEGADAAVVKGFMRGSIMGKILVSLKRVMR